MSVKKKVGTAQMFHSELRDFFDTCKRERESNFKHSSRWEYLKENLLKAARQGKKHIVVEDINKDIGRGKGYVEWEIELFTDEYELLYCFDINNKNSWRVYWL